MNRLFVKRKKNNKGSTLIIVIVVVALIAILATTTISAAMLNYRMKIAGSESKRSFYTAEEAVDQLYSCLGILTMKNLNVAYSQQMATVTRQNASGASYLVSNERCNSELREKFAKDTVVQLFGIDTWTPSGSGGKITSEISEETPKVKETVRDLLNSYIEDYDATNTIISVKTVGDCYIEESPSPVYANLYNFTIKIDDVAVEYKNEQGYFSNVTVDTELALPDLLIAFTDVNEEALLTFGDYAIIGCNGVDIEASQGLVLNNAKLYAGINGLKLAGNASFSTTSGSVVNTPGAVTINGSGASATNTTNFTIDSNSRLWCTDLTTALDSKWSTININGSAFVADDLDINGENHVVNVNGNYIGYNYEEGASVGHKHSSAMMLNGKNCSLNMRGVTSFMLGGRSFIRFGDDNNYATGESASLRANQEVYLLPDSFLKDVSDSSKYYSNPVTYANKGNVSVQIPDSFFAKKYLDETNPVTMVTVGEFTYYYFNIKDENKKDYITDIVNYDSAKGVDIYVEGLRRVLMADLLELQQSLLITPGENSNIYASSAMITVSLSEDRDAVLKLATQTNVSYTAADLQTAKTDLTRRFQMVNNILYEKEFYEKNVALTGSSNVISADRIYLNDADMNAITVDGKNVDVSEQINNSNVFTNFINIQELYKLLLDINETTDDGFRVFCSKNTDTINLTDLGITKGLVITDGSVVVSNDFDGLIFANGQVTIRGNLTVRNTFGGIENMLEKLDDEVEAQVRKLFNAWGGTNIPDPEDPLDYNIGGITYKHIIDFNNWRKSAPVIIDGEGETESSTAAVGLPEVGF